MAKKITVIPANKDKNTFMPLNTTVKRKVAGYARVSTDSDEQFTSYEAQVDYYTKLIKSRSDWEFVGVYTDEGISGVSTAHRTGFNKMIDDALSGKIDLIVTKSVSRFARNTVDSLTTVRKLKEKGVEIYFEKENIFTLDSKGELLITIMSSLAQEESRSISQNVTWGKRKAFSDGKIYLPYSHFLGYRRGKDGRPEIVEKEAEIVRLIYRTYLSGKTTVAICKMLDEMGVPTPSGKEHWSQTTVQSILTNEKYKGDALLQKKFTVDFLTKKSKRNEGEVQQYYVGESHPAIIEPSEWDMVQVEIERRRELPARYSGTSVFASKLICEDCGGFYGRKVWHSTDKWRRVIWQCNGKFKRNKPSHENVKNARQEDINQENAGGQGGVVDQTSQVPCASQVPCPSQVYCASQGKSALRCKCRTPHLEEEAIKQCFLEAYNLFMGQREQLLADCLIVIEKLSDFEKLDAKLEKAEKAVECAENNVRACIQENARTALSQDEYQNQYNTLVERCQKAYSKRDKLRQEREKQEKQIRETEIFVETLKKQPLVLTQWDDFLWMTLVENGIVHRDGSITFRFKNGSEVTVDSGVKSKDVYKSKHAGEVTVSDGEVTVGKSNDLKAG